MLHSTGYCLFESLATLASYLRRRTHDPFKLVTQLFDGHASPLLLLLPPLALAERPARGVPIAPRALADACGVGPEHDAPQAEDREAARDDDGGREEGGAEVQEGVVVRIRVDRRTGV